MGDTKAEREHHRPWYGDYVCALGWGWGVVGAQVMVWAKPADHHGAADSWSQVATRIKNVTPNVS